MKVQLHIKVIMISEMSAQSVLPKKDKDSRRRRFLLAILGPRTVHENDPSHNLLRPHAALRFYSHVASGYQAARESMAASLRWNYLPSVFIWQNFFWRDLISFSLKLIPPFWAFGFHVEAKDSSNSVSCLGVGCGSHPCQHSSSLCGLCLPL